MKVLTRLLVLWFTTSLFILACNAQIQVDDRFRTLTLNEEFRSEGATFADINDDGINDIVSGPFWYEGPEFRERHAYTVVKDYSIKVYSDQFFSFTYDFDDDGDLDVLNIPIPGLAAVWHQNPGGESANDTSKWMSHVVLEGVDNESPTLTNLVGDQRPELICIHKGDFGYASWDANDPTKPWKFTRVTEGQKLGRFTHGLGIGDVDGDGLNDIIETRGWWKQKTPDELFQFHPFRFAQSGGSQMFAYDFDGDGDQDILSAQNAHGFGLTWFERRGTGDDFLFVPHPIMTDDIADNEYAIAVSQLHAVGLADIDGDGVKDIVTGKRFFAHGGKDPGAHQPALLIWFKTDRTGGATQFVPHVIHHRSGVGTQVTLGDIDANGQTDILVGNKLGTYVSFNRGNASQPLPKSDSSISRIGTKDFSIHVRETEPLSPTEEAATFVLPEGFEAQLVAAEPDIGKPMNLAFDTRGRLWVSSSTEYPHPAPPNREPKDTIKILEDADGDGRAEKITTFADGLNIPIGLYPYRDGVVCFSIPNILFLRDTDGDDRCDERIVLYGPMDTTQDTHGMCNAFTRGLDGWLYACHGFNNQTTVSGTDGHEITMKSGNTFRFRLDGSRIEHFTHGQVNPFGMAFDSNGDLFTADCHTKPITLLMNGGHYQSFGKPHDGLGFVPDVMQHLHGSTGIGGIAIYESTEYPREYQSDSFGGNVMTGRINRNSIRHIGSTVRAREEPDFLVSGDPWFRPVDLQLGPDGALYVADFYNRIIGHYEVDLNHPGRDRHRGRIWRIVFTNGENRRDALNNSELIESPAHPATGNDTAFANLSSSNLTRRMLAADALAEALADAEADSIANIEKTMIDGTENEMIHSAWVLSRLGAIDIQTLQPLLNSENARVRKHAYSILGNLESNDQTTAAFLRALKDSDALALRSAVASTSQRPSEAFISPLLERLEQTNKDDVHLRHAIRMSLRTHLQNNDWFRSVTGDLNEFQRATILNLCLGIKTNVAGRFMLDNLSTIRQLDRDQISQYLEFAVQYANESDFDALASLVQSKFADDHEQQEHLIESIRRGIVQHQSTIPPSIKNWAHKLAAVRLGLSPDGTLPKLVAPIAWSYHPHPNHDSGNDNCWVTSTKRRSADGQEETLLHSSFPKGEHRTGIYRSEPFGLPEDFSFYMAGHDGYPRNPIQKNNWVRLNDLATKKVLAQWSPPRNDVAQRFAFDSKQLAGNLVYLELVDGDPERAYAWLAVGRFSVEGLNPSDRIDNWRVGLRIVRDFQLDSLHDVCADLIQHKGLDSTTAKACAQALISSQQNSFLRALAESFNIAGVSGQLRSDVIQHLTSERDNEVPTTIVKRVMLVADSRQQSRLGSILCEDAAGAGELILLMQSGVVSPRLLSNAAIRSKLEFSLPDEQRSMLDSILNSVPDEDSELRKLVEARQKKLSLERGDDVVGKTVFQKHCSVCHQIAGEGKRIGPNLDGIGNRGLNRIVEDVYLPNQNIDPAFRQSVVLTDEGKVFSGFAREKRGGSLLLIDSKGEEKIISNDSIEKHTRPLLSPMPSNFSETLSDQESSDLFAYLLKQTK